MSGPRFVRIAAFHMCLEKRKQPAPRGVLAVVATGTIARRRCPAPNYCGLVTWNPRASSFCLANTSRSVFRNEVAGAPSDAQTMLESPMS